MKLIVSRRGLGIQDYKLDNDIVIDLVEQMLKFEQAPPA